MTDDSMSRREIERADRRLWWEMKAAIRLYADGSRSPILEGEYEAAAPVETVVRSLVEAGFHHADIEEMLWERHASGEITHPQPGMIGLNEVGQ